MESKTSKQTEFLELLERHTTHDGVSPTPIRNLHTFRISQVNERKPQVYPPGIVIGAQGKKHIYLKGKRYVYGRGHMIASFLSMAALCGCSSSSTTVNPIRASTTRAREVRFASGMPVVKSSTSRTCPPVPRRGTRPGSS